MYITSDLSFTPIVINENRLVQFCPKCQNAIISRLFCTSAKTDWGAKLLICSALPSFGATSAKQVQKLRVRKVCLVQLVQRYIYTVALLH